MNTPTATLVPALIAAALGCATLGCLYAAGGSMAAAAGLPLTLAVVWWRISDIKRQIALERAMAALKAENTRLAASEAGLTDARERADPSCSQRPDGFQPAYSGDARHRDRGAALGPPAGHHHDALLCS